MVTPDQGDTGDLKDRTCVVVVIVCQGLRASSMAFSRKNAYSGLKGDES